MSEEGAMHPNALAAPPSVTSARIFRRVKRRSKIPWRTKVAGGNRIIVVERPETTEGELSYCFGW